MTGQVREVYGGYCPILTGQIANICALKKEKLITFTALRVYLACHEERKKRCKHNAKQVQYRVGDICKLLGGDVSEDSVNMALKQLEQFKLLRWCETGIVFSSELLPEAEEMASKLGTDSARPVPIPRRLLRKLIKHTKPSELIAALAHCIRCLFKKGKEITARGLIKSTWVAQVFGVSERAVQAARKWLIGLGCLVRQEVHQLVMNKWGGCFEFNLLWGGIKREVRSTLKPKPQKARFAPPRNNHLNIKILTKYQYRSTYQTKKSRTTTTLSRGSGFSKEKGSKKSPPILRDTPTIKDIHPEDLNRLSRLLPLYEQATKAGWLKPSEANQQNFVAAAVRATRVAGDSVRIFVGIVRKGLWHYITGEQERRAMEVIKRHRVKQEHKEAVQKSEESKCQQIQLAALTKGLLQTVPQVRVYEEEGYY